MKSTIKHFVGLALSVVALEASAAAAERFTPPPEVKEGESYPQLILRDITIIEGTLAPPISPVDIVIEGGRIKSIHLPGAVGSSAYSKDVPVLKPGGREINGKGLYVMPGLIDNHQHIGSQPEYEFKLNLAHGITTIRDPGSGLGLNNILGFKKKAEQGLITAPKIKAYLRFGFYPDGSFNLPTTDAAAREWVRMAQKAGADGIKDAGFTPKVIKATLDEAKKLGMRVMIHHRQTMVARWNALDSAKAGATQMEHWYGLPEAMFTDRTVQGYSDDFNYQNEQMRFGQGGTLYSQGAAPYSEKWNQVLNEMLATGFTLDPTMVVYEKLRDYMRARTQEWFADYAFPDDFAKRLVPSEAYHGASQHYWTTKNEADWREQFQLWQAFINEYKNRGGRVTTGSDEALVYGFSLIRELELLQEAGFLPLEVVRSATLSGAEALGIDEDTGSVEIGKLADLVIVDKNPLENFKVLYGTGAIKLMDDDSVQRVGGVKYTIKEGTVYDAKKLLSDVKAIVDAEKAKTGAKIVQPGFKP
ncbi:MAG: amidohydrolase family protein [Steroidobacteraceae bacterium]